MKSKTTKSPRTLDQVSKYELMDPIRALCEGLNIPGSLSYYNIYQALYDEQKKAKEAISLRKLSRKEDKWA